MKKSKFFSTLIAVLLLVSAMTAVLPLTACEEEVETYQITYNASEGGIIGGQKNQTVEQGGKTSHVTAIPLDGWYFEGWSDGYAQPIRRDENVQQDGEFTAIFAPVEEPDAGEGEEGELPVEPDAEPQSPEVEQA